MASPALRRLPVDPAPGPGLTGSGPWRLLRAGAGWASRSPIVYLVTLAALWAQAKFVYGIFWPVWFPPLLILLVLAAVLLRQHRLTLAAFGLAVALLTLTSTLVAIRARFHYGLTWVNHDGAIQTEEAINRILQGKPIYGIDWSHTTMAQLPWADPTRGAFNPALHHYAYWPLTALIGLPVNLLDRLLGFPFDYRMALLAFIPICLLGIWLLPIDGTRRLLIAAIVLLDPFFLVYFWYGQNDLVFMALLFVGLGQLARNRPVVASLMIGGAVAFKPFALPAVPFLLAVLWLRWRRHHRVRESVLAILALAAIPAVTVLPFLLADPLAFFRDTVLYSDGSLPDSYPIAGIGFSVLLLRLHLVGLHGAFPFGLVEMVAMGVALGLTLPRFLRRPSLGAWLFSYTLLLFAMAFFARHYEHSHNAVILTLLACCLPLRGGPWLAPGLKPDRASPKMPFPRSSPSPSGRGSGWGFGCG